MVYDVRNLITSDFEWLLPFLKTLAAWIQVRNRGSVGKPRIANRPVVELVPLVLQSQTQM